MANNTALRAGKDTTRTITFKNKEHEKFYYTYLPKCRYQDVYHKALVYCLGIDRDTRENAEQIYDFKTGYVKTECLHEGWQTSGSVRIIRLAFNLYCDGTPSVYDYEGDSDRQVDECREYSVSDLFCCGYARADNLYIVGDSQYYSKGFLIDGLSATQGYRSIGTCVIPDTEESVYISTNNLRCYFYNEDYWIKFNEIGGWVDV